MFRFQIPKNFVTSKIAVFEQAVFSARSGPPANPPAQEKHPIVMIHGAVVSRRYMMPAALELSKEYDVIVLDLPGHGASSKPERALPVVRQAEIINEWLGLIQVPCATIFANSYGCEIAVELAIRHPELVHQLILSGPAADPAAPTVFRQAMRLLLNGFVEHPSMQIVLALDVLDLGLKRFNETCKIMVEYDYRPRLPLVRQSTLLIRGSRDSIAPRAWVDECARLLPDVKFVEIRNAPHNVNYSAPQKLAKVIDAFAD